MRLTNEQQLAYNEVRKIICDRLKTFCFIEEMLRNKSLHQLLTLLHLVVGHRNYLGMFTHTWIVLEEILGTDALWDKPAVEPTTDEESQKQPEEQKPVVN